MKTHFFANPPKHKADPKQLTNLEALKKTPCPMQTTYPTYEGHGLQPLLEEGFRSSRLPCLKKITYMYIIIHHIYIYMGVSKNSGTPKWMVYNGKPY